jgi:hypothetical protein
MRISALSAFFWPLADRNPLYLSREASPNRHAWQVAAVGRLALASHPLVPPRRRRNSIMLTNFGTTGGPSGQRISRRNFLTGALGVAGLTLADVFRLRVQAGTPVQSPKSVIMVWLFGGPSHIDSYDLKPDAPAEVRGELEPIATNVPGFDICELMPFQAKIADKLALLRTVKFDPRTTHYVTEIMSGYAADQPKEVSGRPYFGSVVSRLQKGGSLPPYVHLGGSNIFGKVSDPAYLGEAHRAFQPTATDVANLTLRRDLSGRFDDRKALLGAFDTLRRDMDDHHGTLAGMDSYTARALDMITSSKVTDALDVRKEPEKTRAKYARSQEWLQAIRLAEAGVSVVTLESGMGRNAGGNWDFHGGPKFNQKMYQQYLPDFDQLVHAMVTELHDRGLEKDVAILFWGEMGRTPRINDKGGRDHWPQNGFAVLAGGGFRTGQVIGKTSPRAEFAVDRPCSVQHVLATLYTHLGIDPGQSLKDHSGRPLALLDEVEAVNELKR